MSKKIKWTSLIIAFFFIFAFAISVVKADTIYASSTNIDYEINNDLDELFSFEEYGDGYYITEYKGNVKYLEIPDYYNGKKVTGIKDNIGYDSLGKPYSIDGVFKGQEFIKINFGSNLNYIGSGAFEGCLNLTEITIPENVKRIHHNAFMACKNLSKIDLPQLEYLGNEVFINTAWQNNIIQQNADKYLLESSGNANANKDFFDNEVYYEEEGNLILLKVYRLKNMTKEYAEYTVREGTRLIACQMFDYVLPIKKVVIPNTVKYIGSAHLGPHTLSSGQVNVDGIGCEVVITNNGQILSQSEKTEYFRQTQIEEYSFAKVNIGGVLASYTTNTTTSGSEIYSVPTGVTKITKRAFQNQHTIKEIIISSTVEYIGEEAFKGCNYLEKITFLGGNVILDTSAFEDCIRLNTIVGAEYISQIGKYAFKNCSNLNDITFGDTAILSGAFYGCLNLQSIAQKNLTQIKSIGYNAFYGTALINAKDSNGFAYANDFIIKYYGQATNLIIDKNLADYALEGKNSIQEITLENNIVVGKGAFSRCINLQSVNINSNAISDFCFYNSHNLTTIVGSPSSIGEFAFANTKLDSIDLLATLNIGGFAFYNTSLTNIDICLAQLQDYALFGLNNLQTISATNNQNYAVENGVLYTADKQKLIYYPACASITSLNLDSVVIAKGAFNNCSTGVEITGSVLEIEDRAFYNADIVYSATGTKKVGYKAFYNAKVETLSLTELDFVGEKAFSYCQNLTDLSLISTTNLYLGILKGCNNLTDLNIKLNETSGVSYESHLGYLFGFDYYLGSETILQKHNNSYGKNYYIPKLENITISGGKVSFGALMGLNKLQTANLIDVSDISAFAFANCTNLVSVNLGSDISVIPTNAFANCSKLTSLNAQNKVDLSGIILVGERAFSGCVEITQVDINESLTADKIFNGAFVNCSKLQIVNISSQDFFNIDNKTSVYGNLFDKATQVNVEGNALTQEEIYNLKTFYVQGAKKSFKEIVAENKTTIVCCVFIVLAVLILIVAPILTKKFNTSSVDEYGRPITHHKHKGKHRHHKHHHHHKH